jgi:hypothetical protein
LHFNGRSENILDINALKPKHTENNNYIRMHKLYWNLHKIGKNLNPLSIE